MRVWEVEDGKSIPKDLVREQDFILRVRRMQRIGNQTLVINFVLNAIEPLAKNHTAMEAVQKKLQEFANLSHGIYSDMSNGDVFISWENNTDAHTMAHRLIEGILPDQKVDPKQFLLTFSMPQDYTILRERSNLYIEVVRTSGSVGLLDNEHAVATAQGQLTAKNVDQIEHLLGEIDVRPYGRTQSIYKNTAGAWQVVGEEYFISFEDLRRERFPKLQFASSEHFFLALCGILDQRLLVMLTNNYDSIGGRPINLNLAVNSIVSSVFAQFVRRVPREHRGLIGFELHRGDLFQDFSLTLSAIEVLKREGFRVALDGITPDMLNHIDLSLFPVDAIKINVSKDRAFQLTTPDIRKGLSRISNDKIIFFRCDSDKSLNAGLELGVKTFQGWLIDDLASKKKTSP